MKRIPLWVTHLLFIVCFILFLFNRQYFSSSTQIIVYTVFIVTLIAIAVSWFIYYTVNRNQKR
ncbi:membrane protein [Bacillus haynesii]|nr:membrane protein [Bacillus haynesii]